MSLTLGQTADLLATLGSKGTEVSPLFHSPVVWFAAKLTAVTAAAVVMKVSSGSTLMTRMALWLGIVGALTAVWNLTGGSW